MDDLVRRKLQVLWLSVAAGTTDNSAVMACSRKHRQLTSELFFIYAAKLHAKKVIMDYWEKYVRECKKERAEELVKLNGYNLRNHDGAMWCPYCELWLNGPDQWDDHEIGKKHKKNMKKIMKKNMMKKENEKRRLGCASPGKRGSHNS